jgi:hypothetical protein
MVTSCSQGDGAVEGISLTNHETGGGRSVLPTAQLIETMFGLAADGKTNLKGMPKSAASRRSPVRSQYAPLVQGIPGGPEAFLFVGRRESVLAVRAPP